MKWTISDIAQWHKETFPDATLRKQMEKFQEEKKEWLASQHITDEGIIDGDITELADMVIVACGCSRFSDLEAIFQFRTIANELEPSRFATIDLEKAIDDKMNINKTRTWNNNNGFYKHKAE